MDGTVVLAVALGLGSLLLWSLLVLMEDMAGSRRGKHRTVPERRPPEARRTPPPPAHAPPPTSYDPRFEQLVDQWFGPEDADPDDPWRRTA